MKICNRCNLKKDINEFYKRKDNGLIRNQCRKCVNLKNKETKLKNPQKHIEKRKASVKKRMEKDPLYRVKKWLKSDYNLTIEEYNIQLELQNNCCYLCKRIDTVRLAVDHCHKTGKLRGLLCSLCNQAIGKLQDNPEIIEKALKYILSNGVWHSEKYSNKSKQINKE